MTRALVPQHRMAVVAVVPSSDEITVTEESPISCMC